MPSNPVHVEGELPMKRVTHVVDPDAAMNALWLSRRKIQDDAAIADLPPQTISHMSDSELVGVIRAARLPLMIGQCLQFQDRRTLERLAYLARRCCQNRLGEPLWQTSMPATRK